jgi:hypothetical protein
MLSIERDSLSDAQSKKSHVFQSRAVGGRKICQASDWLKGDGPSWNKDYERTKKTIGMTCEIWSDLSFNSQEIRLSLHLFVD